MSGSSLSANRISIFLLIALFMLTPIHQLQKLIFIYPLFLVWFGSSCSIDKNFLSKTAKWWGYFVCFAVLWLIYTVFHREWEFLHFINHIFLTYMWILMFVFYRSHKKIFSPLIYPTLAMILVSCGYTFAGNLIFPGASRVLGSSASELSIEKEIAIQLHVGGFGFIYSLTFLVIPMVDMFKMSKKKWQKIVMVIMLVGVIATIVVASYFMAILFATIFIILANSSSRNRVRTIMILVFLGTLAFLAKDYILLGLMDLGQLIDSHMLYARAEQMLEGTYQSHYEEGGNLSRYDLMKNGVLNFLASPIVGQMCSDAPNLTSGHSEFIGYLEKYGFFGIAYILYFIKILQLGRKTFMTEQGRMMYTFLFIGIVCVALFNTFSISCEAGLVGFFLAPLLMLSYEHPEQNNKRVKLQKDENTLFFYTPASSNSGKSLR